MKIGFKIVLKILAAIFCAGFILFFVYFFIGQPKPAEKIIWGVNFSQKHSEKMGLDWKKNYLALLDDLKVKRIKIAAHWDLIEPKDDKYYFDDLDWQIQQAEEKGAKLLLVIGMKTSRWPECHIPDWAKNLGKKQQQEEILELLKEFVLRYRERNSILSWQVENEPLFPFGECPWTDKEFLKKEIVLVKSLDQEKKPVIISVSGELSFWLEAARLGDVVGTSMYKKVWSPELKMYFNLPYPPIYYWRKALLIKKIFKKEIICVELQTEPWGPELLYYSPIFEQEKTMNLEQFRKNVEFAKKTGLNEFYLWGAEWWYWLKEKQNKPEIWEEAKKLFKNYKINN